LAGKQARPLGGRTTSKAEATPPPADVDLSELIARAHVLLKRAVLTLAELPDGELRYLSSGSRSPMPQTMPDPELAYDSDAQRDDVARAMRFRPTPKDVSRYLTVWQWLMWLKRQGEEGETGVRLIIHRAHSRRGWSSYARRAFGKSDDTISRWYQNAVMRIAVQFWQQIQAWGE
jgi:hypothetical protein